MSSDDIIDLTESFILIDHPQLLDSVIEIDDSISYSPKAKVPSTKRRCNIQPRKVKKFKKDEIKDAQANKENDSKNSGFGGCPICWDDLGTNPLASTKCGHVFCLHCITQVVKQTKHCPTCRHPLKGSSAYHPIYLSLK